MKAMLLHKNANIESKPLLFEEYPTPRPLKKELLVEVNVCAVCRTDLHVIEGDLKCEQFPIIPGHQIVGRVLALGENCSRFKIGDRVGIAWLHSTCQHCSFCLEGNENLCTSSTYTGYQKLGGYAEYTTIPEEYAYRIPDDFTDDEAAPLLCSGIVGFRAYKRSGILPGKRLGIYGFGSSAHIIIQIALFQGCEVYVSSRNKNHQELAKEMGAHWAGNEAFPELLDSIIIFAPAGNLVPLALQSVKAGGTVCIAGIHMSEIPQMSYNTHLFHEKNLKSVEANTRMDGEEFLALAAKIPIKAHTTSFPLKDANDALLQMKNDRINGTAVLQIKNAH